MPRRRRRGQTYGGGGGGGGINLASLFGAGDAEANPAFGAEGPGDVDYTYEGDPSKAMAKYGTTDMFKKPGFWGRLARNPADTLNAQYRMGLQGRLDQADINQAFEDYQNAQKIANIPKEVAARAEAEAIAKRDADNRAVIQGMADQELYARLESARTGAPVNPLHPVQIAGRYGNRATTMGLPLAEAMTQSGLQETDLAGLAAQQEAQTRRQHEPDVIEGLRAGFRRPVLANEGMELANLRDRNDPRTAGIYDFGNVLLQGGPGGTLKYRGAIMPGERGGEQIPRLDASGKFTGIDISKATPPGFMVETPEGTFRAHGPVGGPFGGVADNLFPVGPQKPQGFEQSKPKPKTDDELRASMTPTEAYGVLPQALDVGKEMFNMGIADPVSRWYRTYKSRLVDPAYRFLWSGQ